MSDKQKWEVFRQDITSGPPDGSGWEPFAGWREDDVQWHTDVILWRRIKPSVAAEPTKRSTPPPPAKFRRIRVCNRCHQGQGPACKKPDTCGEWALEGGE